MFKLHLWSYILFKPGCEVTNFVRRFYLSTDLNRVMDSETLLPPSTVRGMKILNRDLFFKTIQVPIVILPKQVSNINLKLFKSFLLKLQNFRPIRVLKEFESLTFEDSDSVLDNEIAVLDPRKIKKFEDLREKLSQTLEESFKVAKLTLNYTNWKADDILRCIIPEEFDSVSGYSIVGHILHLNLRTELYDYKNIIGDILLDKVANVRTVVNKTENINSEFRNFKLELLGGEENYITEVKENKCKFQFDFSTVYWNPRLSTEHERVVKSLEKNDILIDVFCGVGPFSIPAAKKGCTVLSNDLNPESITWLKKNIELNRLNNTPQVFNKDGHDFIKNEIKDYLLQLRSGTYSIKIAMNLPSLAPTFLKSFKGLYNSEEFFTIEKLPTPVTYIYCFVKGSTDLPKTAKEMIEKELEMILDKEIQDICFVRNVAPKKDMMRVDLLLTKSILLKNEHNKVLKVA